MALDNNDYVRIFTLFKNPSCEIKNQEDLTTVKKILEFKPGTTRHLVSVNHKDGSYDINLFAKPIPGSTKLLKLNINLDSSNGSKTLNFSNLDEISLPESVSITVKELKNKFSNSKDKEKLFEFLGFLDNIIVHSGQYVDDFNNKHGRQTTEANLNSILNSSYRVCHKKVYDNGAIVAKVYSNNYSYSIICDDSNPKVIKIFNRDIERREVSKIRVSDISFTTPQPDFKGLDMAKKGRWEHDRDLGRIDRAKFKKLIEDINNFQHQPETPRS
jgi:hypothetical protein